MIRAIRLALARNRARHWELEEKCLQAEIERLEAQRQGAAILAHNARRRVIELNSNGAH